MRNKKNIQNASVLTDHENVAEKLLIVDAFQTAMRSRPSTLSFDQQLIEGYLYNQK